MKRRLLLLSALACACSGSLQGDPEVTSDWQVLEQVAFQEDGQTPWVLLPDSPSGLSLRVTADSEVCFGLSAAEGPAGEELARRFAGQECSDCEVRSSVAVEAAVFVLPRASQVRFGVSDCQTLNPLRRAAGSLRVEAQPVAQLDAPVLPLRMLVTPGSALETDSGERDRLLAALTDELIDSGVEPRLTGVETLGRSPGRLRFHAGDPAELATLVEGHPAREDEVRVVVAGCLEYADPFFGPPIALDGYTPRVVGGAGPADAVFLPDVDCTSSLALAPTPESRGRTLAHELGHYLGLFHADPDGEGDTNLMSPNPSLAAAHGLTPDQVRVLRRHPILQ